MKYIFGVFSVLFLIYLLAPGPGSIKDFPALPDSAKSTLSGDTVELPNIAGYFSNNYRGFVTSFYKSHYNRSTWLPFPPIRLNYPPEYAFTAIKVQTHSTYLEEYVYPLRDSLFVNGLEPFEQSGKPRYSGAVPFKEEGGLWETKTTLRYYPSSYPSRILIFFGVELSLIFLWKIGRKIIING